MTDQPASKPLRLDLGCGDNKQPGFTGVDIAKTASVDVQWDLLQFPWPWADNSVDQIHCSHFIEHIPMLCACCSGKQLDPWIAFFNEVYRVMKAPYRTTGPDGNPLDVRPEAKFIAPYWNNIRCWQDPTHRRAINDGCVLYLNKGWRDANKLSHYGFTCDFDWVTGYDMRPDLLSRNEQYRQFAFQHYSNTINDIHIILTKRV